jgi:hypothetical protein
MPVGDPVSCLCGSVPAASCVFSPQPPTGPCAAEYAAAAQGFPGDIYSQFFDPSTPAGIANNLASCDFDGKCTATCSP